MISPPETSCPPKTFTPSRCPGESRPLRLDPSPFLCAIAALPLRCARSDLADLDLRQLLAVPAPTLVAALGLELEHPQLLAALVREHARAHPCGGELLGGAAHLPVAHQQRLERDRLSDRRVQALDVQALPALHAVLLAAAFHYRVDLACHWIDHLPGAAAVTRPERASQRDPRAPQAAAGGHRRLMVDDRARSRPDARRAAPDRSLRSVPSAPSAASAGRGASGWR